MRLRQVKVCVLGFSDIYLPVHCFVDFYGFHVEKYTNRQPWIPWGSSTCKNLAGDSTGYWVEGGWSTQVGCRNWHGENNPHSLYS